MGAVETQCQFSLKPDPSEISQDSEMTSYFNFSSLQYNFHRSNSSDSTEVLYRDGLKIRVLDYWQMTNPYNSEILFPQRTFRFLFIYFYLCMCVFLPLLRFLFKNRVHRINVFASSSRARCSLPQQSLYKVRDMPENFRPDL